MDALVKCHICTNPYLPDICVPRMLPCGHTICTPCLSKIIYSDMHCPDCRQSISGNSASNFPINFLALQLNGPSTKISVSDDLLSKVTTLLRYCSIVENKFNSLQIDCGKKLKALCDSKQKLKDMVARWNDQMAEEVLTTEDILKKQLNDICELVPGVVPIEVLKTISVDPITFKSSDFENGNLFLSEIYKNVSDGVNVVGILESEEGLKYAKLSVWKNILKVHSLDSFEKTTSLAIGTKTVWFQDLKRRMEETGQLTVFFVCGLFEKLYHLHVFFKLFENPFNEHFLGYICGGEVETFSLKGTSLNVCNSNFHTSSGNINSIFYICIDSLLYSLFKFYGSSTPPSSSQENLFRNGGKYLVINDSQIAYGKRTFTRISNSKRSHAIGICDLEEIERCSASKYLDTCSHQGRNDIIIDCGISAAFPLIEGLPH